MAAADYYGTHPDYGGEDGRRREGNSPVPTPKDERPTGPQHTLTATSPTSPTLTTSTPYPHSPYAPTSDDDLSHPPYGASSSSHYDYNTPDTSYHPPHSQRESTASIATQSKQYSDPYAENIPLNTRRPSMPSPHGSASSIPPGESSHPKHNPLHPNHKKNRPRPWFCWLMTAIQVSVFIAEIARNAILTGSPIAIKPTFNPMIGPSPYVQINMGGRYVLCMQYQEDLWEVDGQPVTGPVLFPCPNTTKADAQCTLAEHCGFSGVPSQEEMMRDHVGPNQWYRFIIPMFLHAGLVHIAFNMLLQLRLGVDMEREIGPVRFAIVYFSAGIFGFILGGNFAPRGVVSTGASGCLFGVLALVLLDLLYTWSERPTPGKDLAWLLVDIVISFVLGLLPGLDNFAHIGGFLMGLMLGLTVLHSPTRLRKRIGEGSTYSAMMSGGSGGHHHTKFYKDPVGFFKGRKGMWWVWWAVRAGTLTCAIVVTIVLLRGFYVSRVECGWCKYLSCLPVSNWCEIGELQIQSTNTTGTG